MDDIDEGGDVARPHRSARLTLEPPRQQQDEEDDDHQADDPAGAIAPGAAVAPGGEHPDERENKDDEDDGADAHRDPLQGQASMSRDQLRRLREVPDRCPYALEW